MRRLAGVLVALLVLLSGCAQAPTDMPLSGASGPADPPQDVLGWEGGYWYNESLPVTVADGLNESERRAVVTRSMARVEHIRRIEFEKRVPVEVISRQTFRERYAGGGNVSESLRTFDNVKFESMFLVGENRDSIAQQNENRGSSVLGFYSPSQDRIVIISESETPTIEELTLGHELTHALQFRNFQTNYSANTRDERNAVDGLIEGDAEYVTHRYESYCGDEWQCVTPKPASPSNSSSQGNASFHLGIYILKYFPYSDGPGFVAHVKDDGSWRAVNDLYGAPPASAEQVAVPAKYRQDAPTNVSLDDRSSADWRRVRPPGRADYGEVGVSGLTAMFAWPAYESQRHPQRGVLPPRQFLNVGPDGNVNRTDPFNYTSPPVEGWDGDKLYVYRHANSGETAYVWRLVWDSPRDAAEFAATYRDLLRYWGARQVSDGVWRIPEGESPYADAFYVHVEGDAVTIVNAPSVDQLDDVRSGTPTPSG